MLTLFIADILGEAGASFNGRARVTGKWVLTCKNEFVDNSNLKKVSVKKD